MRVGSVTMLSTPARVESGANGQICKSDSVELYTFWHIASYIRLLANRTITKATFGWRDDQKLDTSTELSHSLGVAGRACYC